MRNVACGRVALDGIKDFACEMCAQFVIRVMAEPCTQILLGSTAGKVVAQQALDSFRYQRRGAAIAHRARNCGVHAYCSTEAEVISVGEFALVLDLLAFDANICDPMLAATVRATRYVKPKLLIKLRQPLFESVDQPARETFCFGDGQLAELSACASHGTTPERRAIHVATDL